MLHLGLGAFCRAHLAVYTAHAVDADAWGIAAYAGRRPDLARQLRAQDGCYTLVTRGPDVDRFETITSIARAHAATEHESWLASCAAPEVAAITLTITEAGHLRRTDGGLDLDHPLVVGDRDLLRRDRSAPVHTPVARLVAGLDARRRAGGDPVAVVSCDNLPDNGAALRRVVQDLASAVDPGLGSWVDEAVAFPTSMVDRITPRTTDRDRTAVRDAIGVDDRCPVVTEPFTEWVLTDRFPQGRPAWQTAGARFVDDVEPFERRKLWLLNGAHSLLAYAGSALGHRTVAEAFADDRCRAWVELWWDDAARHLALPPSEITSSRAALAARFANARIEHHLAQIAADGSQKLPVRTLPVVHAARSLGIVPHGACLTLGAWIAHLRGAGAPVSDPRADALVPLAAGPLRDAVPQVLAALDPGLGADDEVAAAVVDATEAVLAGT